MAHRKQSTFFSIQTAMSLIAITAGVIIMIIVFLVLAQAPCISNFYNHLPTYPDAELVAISSSSLNYLAVGELSQTYETPDRPTDVGSWYHREVDVVRSAASRARVRGEEVPPTWNHHYIITALPNGDGTQIYLVANCLN